MMLNLMTVSSKYGRNIKIKDVNSYLRQEFNHR
jgi:hypothetical protein